MLCLSSGDRVLRAAHNNFGRTALLRALLSLCIVFVAFPQVAAAAGKPGYFIHQRSAFLGQRDVFMTDSGFMAINHVSGHILITRAPDWLVRVANLRSKLYYVTPFETWMGRKVALGEKTVRGLTNQKPKSMPGQRVICGLRVKRFKLDTRGGLEKRYINGQRDMNDFEKVDYWVAPDLPFPKPAQNIILTFYQLPYLSGFPLEVNYSRGKHSQPLQHLLTTEVKKQTVDDSVFELPKSCKKASFEAEVWVDDKTREMFEMFK